MGIGTGKNTERFTEGYGNITKIKIAIILSLGTFHPAHTLKSTKRINNNHLNFSDSAILGR